MLTPFILAGGLSTRMGEDKAMLHVGGSTLLEQAIARLRPLGTPILLSGDPERSARRAKLAAFGETVPDRTPNAGPLGGIDAALHSLQTDWALIVPIDQPFLPTAALSLLVAETWRTSAGAGCFVQATVPEPLPLLIHASLGPAVAAALHAGERQLLPTLQRIASGRLHECRKGQREWFVNLNTPADLESCQAP